MTEPSAGAIPGPSASGDDDRGRTVTISEALEVSAELVAAFEILVPQLSSSSPAPTAAQLAEIVASPATVLFVASDESGALVGSLTLALFRVPTGVLSWIEDVVVDGSARGAGAGEKLVAAALDRAHEVGAKSVDLTSRPSREAANRLYLRMGFETRQTNVYRYKMSGT
ncbi:MAG TPA: GNAT family N-acetyltransferase [Acidimicrobiales bacterium]|nr:GNAT family N-acetyltransferase [Acidimicrobiales bacterium]